MRARTITIAIGVAAAGAMALGAQSAAAVVKYDTELTIRQEEGSFSGTVWSERVTLSLEDRENLVRKCMNGRRVALFKQRPGADRKLGTDISAGGDPTNPNTRSGDWQVSAPKGALRHADHVYAKARRKVGDGYVCRADRSERIVKYDTKATIAMDPQGRGRWYHGEVRSKVTKCMERRRVILFKVRPGPNRVLGWARTQLEGGPEDDTPRFLWEVQALVQASLHSDLYAKVHRERGDGFVCRKVRSRII